MNNGALSRGCVDDTIVMSQFAFAVQIGFSVLTNWI